MPAYKMSVSTFYSYFFVNLMGKCLFRIDKRKFESIQILLALKTKMLFGFLCFVDRAAY